MFAPATRRSHFDVFPADRTKVVIVLLRFMRNRGFQRVAPNMARRFPLAVILLLMFVRD